MAYADMSHFLGAFGHSESESILWYWFRLIRKYSV